MRNTVLADDDGLPVRGRLRRAGRHRRPPPRGTAAPAGPDRPAHRDRQPRRAVRRAAPAAGGRGPGCALLFCDLDQFKAGQRRPRARRRRPDPRRGRRRDWSRWPARATWWPASAATSSSSCARGPDEADARHARPPRVTARGGRRSRDRRVRCTIGVSVGVAVGRPGETADDLIGRADRAMYGAKTHQRRRVPPR